MVRYIVIAKHPVVLKYLIKYLKPYKTSYVRNPSISQDLLPPSVVVKEYS